MSEGAHGQDADYETLLRFLYLVPVGLVQTGLEGEIALLNPVSAQLLMPLSPDGGLDNLFDLLAPLAPGLRAAAAAYAPASGVIVEGLRLPLPPEGRPPGGPQVLSLSVLKLDAGRLMMVVADATEEVRREQENLSQRLRSAALIDALTRMPNREAVREELRQLLVPAGEASQFAVLLLNCDRFRQVNDKLGQGAGDRLLVHMAERIRTSLRPPSDRIEAQARGGQIAARIGGDEFVVVLDSLRQRADAESVASRLLDALARPYHIEGSEVMCGASLGLVWGADAARDPDHVLRDAGIAMVEAKRAGGSRLVVFDPGMRERAARRADLEAGLRTALAEQQLFVVYQPVLGLLPNGGLDHSAGVEALVRWRHPQRGIVPPVEFIPVAEECGLIGAVGDFVLERACRDFVDWTARLGERAPRLMAVNLSRAQLAQPGWNAAVEDILRATGMPPGQLQLEITESLAAQDDAVQDRLHELKALGIQLALDDFGTGYSSLSSLHLLPVDTVKIDRSFVSQADTSHHHQVLIEATVKVAQSLGMKTVAEGIETASQAEVVRSRQCDKVQGYLFSRPLPAAELLAWLDARVAASAEPPSC